MYHMIIAEAESVFTSVEVRVWLCCVLASNLTANFCVFCILFE